MIAAALRRTDHRPWPLPDGPWVMAQSWRDLLFAHWPIDVAAMRVVVPRVLELDTFDGAAWVGVVPFRMSGVRLRGTPGVPWLSAFPELNLRTYVTVGGQPGVHFLALEATNPIAIAIARRWFHLPYHRARMRCAARGVGIEYASERIERDAAPAIVEVGYEPVGPVEPARRGSFEHWLTERYCLYALDGANRVHRGDIHHVPWPLQKARARFEVCTLPAAHGLKPRLDTDPHVLFARRLDVAVWAPRRVSP